MQDNEGRTALHEAADAGHYNMINSLVSKDVVARQDSYGRTALHWAVNNGHELAAKTLLEHMTADQVMIPDKLSQTDLHRAAQFGFETIVSRIQETLPETT
ncbi:ankyrin repeat domain-containing protein 50-like isoform X1 [Ophiocordyceps camponoti-floridani]|uniref:Ankyrin repeat domain-containing protein 50-like isoform X1 n=1 Tax=Ophiocordyceps camponoti-floridani TaxID=2030778 RepID=A0A8H4VEC3_9HYPO|nr:ankyrin repeat domain-containing protein 50-like isoform X1 [Ophiocordyceps camponoti-floridani]